MTADSVCEMVINRPSFLLIVWLPSVQPVQQQLQIVLCLLKPFQILVYVWPEKCYKRRPLNFNNNQSVVLEAGCDFFEASKGWLQNFFFRHNITLRRRMTLCQNLPESVIPKLENSFCMWGHYGSRKSTILITLLSWTRQQSGSTFQVTLRLI